MIRKARGTRRSLKMLVGVFLLLVGGCESIFGPDDTIDPPMQTDSKEYTLEFVGDRWLHAEVSYTYENRTGGPAFLRNCNGSFALRLDRREGFDWEPAWSPVLPLCLSSPIVIEDGETISLTLDVVAGLPGTRTAPRWDREDPSGVYRLVWIDALSSYQHGHGTQLPEEHRVSNAFVLRR